MNLFEIIEDTTAWNYFEGESEYESIAVYRRCPECGKYLTKGDLLMNREGDIKLEKWRCKNHGEVKPYFERVENETIDA